MAEIFNLRLARKRKARADKADAADANRLKHGRSATEATATRSAKAEDERRLDAHRREPASDPETPP